jgi:hypothetical protein
MIRRILSVPAGLLALAVAASSALAQSPPNNGPAPSTTAAPQPNAVIEWNRTLLTIVRTKTPQPLQPPTVHATRAFAMLHLGIYDAVVAVDGGKPYLPEQILVKPASAPAAADQAAHDVLAALYPSQQASLDNQLNADLARIPADARLTRGIKAGQAAAQAILANRAQDGSAATPPPYTLPAGPAVFEPTAPATAVFTHWANVKPFTLTRASEFPPAGASAAEQHGVPAGSPAGPVTRAEQQHHAHTRADHDCHLLGREHLGLLE